MWHYKCLCNYVITYDTFLKMLKLFIFSVQGRKNLSNYSKGFALVLAHIICRYMYHYVDKKPAVALSALAQMILQWA